MEAQTQVRRNRGVRYAVSGLVKTTVALSVVVLAVLAFVLSRQVDERPPSPEAWPVVRGSIGGEPIHWYVAYAKGEGVELCPLEEADPPGCRPLDGLSLGALRAQPPATWSNTSTFFLSERLEVTVPSGALGESRYLSGLILGSRGRELRTGRDARVSEALKSGQAPIAWAEAHRGDDGLYEAFARELLFSECLVVDTPQRTTLLFAELALARGDLPTFVDLELQLITNTFPKLDMASAAVSLKPDYERLVKVGVDVDRLLLGLMISWPGAEVSATEQRLARAITDAGRTQALLPRIEALATMPTLDPLNRFRATEVWLHLQASTPEETRARAARLELHPIARLRAQSYF